MATTEALKAGGKAFKINGDSRKGYIDVLLNREREALKCDQYASNGVGDDLKGNEKAFNCNEGNVKALQRCIKGEWKSLNGDLESLTGDGQAPKGDVEVLNIDGEALKGDAWMVNKKAL